MIQFEFSFFVSRLIGTYKHIWKTVLSYQTMCFVSNVNSSFPVNTITGTEMTNKWNMLEPSFCRTSCSKTYQELTKFPKKVPWVPECPSVLRVTSAWVAKCLECLSTLGVLNLPLSAAWVKKVCNITKNELVDSFIEFLKTFRNTDIT